MKKLEAIKAGYQFTGMYKRDKEEVQAEVRELKKQGYKAVVVTEPDSPLSRGPKGTGYSVFAEQKYLRVKELQDNEKRMSYIGERKRMALDEYQRTLREIEDDEQQIREEIERLRNLLNK
jgi:predicted xylose isomerase-like sugar epimerase